LNVVFAAPADVLFAGLVTLFVLTQSAYFVNNVLADIVLYPRKPAIVDEETEPSGYPMIHVLIPLYEEPRAVVERTLRAIERLDYPTENVDVHLVTEPTDEVVARYIDELMGDFDARELDIDRSTVNRRVLATFVEAGTWDLSGEGIPRTKASAIKYAFRTLSLPPTDVVTVFDADTIVPPDTFTIAVAGLETYDVVQAKQTVRNHGEGWLPRLEAMGMAAWCHALYAKTTDGPYQLLGKAYFFEVTDLWILGDWQVDAVTEDLTLGIDAYARGYSLGVIDRYVQDICPSELSAWVAQKRRWVAGPYPYLRHADFSPAELVRFWVYGASNQVIAVLNVVGVPAGILYAAFVLAGFDLYNSAPLVAVTGVNLLNWTYYSVKTYRATLRGVQFSSSRERASFLLISNPLTQLFYSMLWAIPIALALRDYRRDDLGTEFHVTPKQVEGIRAENADD
jgi:cellulose synthase/poly-beta-1,6-N-acetylglucosamine synthase-like glycosyltransferase